MATLIDVGLEDFARLTRVRTSDGEGGSTIAWVQENPFKGTVTLESATQRNVGGKETEYVTYTFTFDKGADALHFHDVLKRISDGKIFRVMTDSIDRETPMQARFGQFAQVNVEGWELV